jgi:hypothetical protein
VAPGGILPEIAHGNDGGDLWVEVLFLELEHVHDRFAGVELAAASATVSIDSGTGGISSLSMVFVIIAVVLDVVDFANSPV